MKKNLSSSTLTLGAVVTGCLLQTGSANAFTINQQPPSTCDFSGAIYCSTPISTNDSLTGDGGGLQQFLQDVNAFVGTTLIADPTTWGNGGLPSDQDFITKVEAPEEGSTASVIEGLEGYLLIGYGGDPDDSTSGTWEVDNLFLPSGKFDGPFVLAMKAGSLFSFNYFDGSVQSGTWSSNRFTTTDKQGNTVVNAFSHATLYAPPESIPTPALLPGLMGMAAAAFRKKQGEAAEKI